MILGVFKKLSSPKKCTKTLTRPIRGIILKMDIKINIKLLGWNYEITSNSDLCRGGLQGLGF